VIYLVVSSPPATEETGDMGREIESRKLLKEKKKKRKKMVKSPEIAKCNCLLPTT
jgi:hypothetical protein